MLNFHDLEKKYGEALALSLLMEMEHHVRLDSTELAGVEPELRLQSALALMDSPLQVAAG